MSEHIVRQTRQKDAIRDALNGCDEFISAQELHRKLEDRGEHIGLATVYRQLNAHLTPPRPPGSSTPWLKPAAPTRSVSTGSSCSACAAMTGTIITSSVRTAAKPWKLNRLPKAG